MTRSPWDGRPYYCIKCALGYGEFIACEMPDCQLEPESDAKARQAQSDTHTGAGESPEQR